MPAAAVRHPRRRCAWLGVCAAALVAGSMLTWSTTAHAAGREVCSGYAACSSQAFTTHGYAAHAATSYWEMDAGDECTNYVAFVEQTEYGVTPPDYTLGDGGAWASTAAAHGVAVDHSPTVGAVAEWGDGTPGIGGPGHVGIVEAVGPDDRWIDVSQQHIDSDPDGFDWMRIENRPSDSRWEPWPSAFIHFATTAILPNGVFIGDNGVKFRLAGAPARRSPALASPS